MSRTALEHQAHVLGDGPRIAPIDVAEMTGDLTEMLDSMAAINALIDSRESEIVSDLIDAQASADPEADMRAMLANLPEIMRTMLRHPELFARQTDIGMLLLGSGALPARDREIAILRAAWLCGAPYEWGEHVIIAKKQGVTPAEIEAIVTGPQAPGWSDHDRAILRAVEELRADAMISDATWATLAIRFDERQMIELPILIGQYHTVAYYQNSLRLRLHSGNLGLLAR
jgi:alkylhydroperoxidase family enzyme